jgi:hypothetical protein
MFAYSNWCHAHCRKWILLECDKIHNAIYENNYVLNFIVEECIVMFKRTRKYNIKSFGLKLEYKTSMEDIYWKVFGIASITNNEMPTWNVRGFTTQSKNIEINWAKAAKSTTK